MCDFPWLFNNATQKCDISYAQHIGIGYKIYHGFFLGLALIIFLITLYQNVRLYLAIEQKIDVKAKIFDRFVLGMLQFMCFLFLIEAIDPMAFNGNIPLIIDSIASNMCTYAGYVIVFAFMYALLSNFKDYNERKYKIGWFFITSFSFTATLITTITQVFVDWNISRSIKLFILAFLIGGSSIILVYTLVSRYFLLKKLEISDFHTKMKNRILKYIICFSIFISVVVSYQLYSAIYSLINPNSELKPELTSDMFIFPVLKLIGMILCLVFKWNVSDKKIEKKKYLPRKLSTLEEMLRSNDQSNHQINDKIQITKISNIV